MTTPHAPHPAPRSALLAAILITLATFAAYIPALSAGFIWDDDAHITRPELQSADGLVRIWTDLGATQQYYPLLHSAFWLQHQLFADNPAGYHAVNVALHAGAAVLFFLALRRLLLPRHAVIAQPAALFAALLFALHPVHVESVAWVTEQKNTLSACFYLSALLIYLRFDESRARHFYLLALALFILGLLTKTVTATLPAAILVILWWQRGRLRWTADILPLILWFILGAGAGLFTAWVEHDLIGAKGEAFNLSLVERGLLSGRVVTFYLSKLLWPSNLTFIYPRWDINASDWSQWLYPLAMLALLITLLIAARRTRSPLAAFLLFGGTLFPVLGFFNVYPFLFSYVADHFQYLASLSIIALVATAMMLIITRLRTRPARLFVAALLPITLGILTFRQSRIYADAETLYTTTIQRNPACWMAHNNLGIHLKNTGRIEQSLPHYASALQLRPDYPEAWNNLGSALAALDRTDDAITAFTKAIQLRPANPEALSNLAAAQTRAGRHDDAVLNLNHAIRYDPANPALHANLGAALLAASRHAEAITALERSLTLNPDQPAIRAQLELARAREQGPEAVVARYQQHLLAHQDDAEAHFALAVALASLKRNDEAITHYQSAVRLNPDHVEAHNNLASLLARSSRVAEAIPHFQAAVRLRPQVIPLRMNLAVALASLKRTDEALAIAGEARELASRGNDPALLSRIDDWIRANSPVPQP